MNQTRPDDALEGQECPCCEKGLLALCQVDYVATPQNETPITVKDVWVEKCPVCGEMVFPSESSDYIASVIAEETEQLTPVQLKEIRERLGVGQTKMSDILGLGDRTYHRWENGTQYPSRSMCYYIRTLGRFPTAFDWLSKREWRKDKKTTKFLTPEEVAERFPDLYRNGEVETVFENTCNPAREFAGVFGRT